MTRGNIFFVFRRGGTAMCAKRYQWRIVGIAVKSKADGTVYGEELEGDESSAEEDEPSAEEDEPADE